MCDYDDKAVLHLTGSSIIKNRRPYNLYCVGADVKPCSINQPRLLKKLQNKGYIRICDGYSDN